MFRKLHLLLVVLFVPLSYLLILAPDASLARAEEAVTVDVLVNTPDRIVIRYDFGEFARSSVRIDNQPYAQIRLGPESLKMTPGEPALPDVSRSIIIADDARVRVNVIDSSYHEIHNIDVAPSKGSILRSVDPATVPYTFGPAYQADADFPATLATLRDPYIMRDHRGIVVTVNPFQYNPIQHVLKVYSTMTIAVEPAGPGAVNVLNRQPRPLARAFHEIYGSHFINYDPPGRYAPLTEDGEMLVIAHDPWLSNVQPFVDHKNTIGISTTLVAVSTIGNDATSIHDYIQDFYTSNPLVFVLLVGDAAQVATAYSGGASDPTYSKLAGIDDYPEIMVGRFSAETADQVDTQVQRTIEYENMPATAQDWYWRGMGIASDQGPGDDGEMDNEHMDVIRGKLLTYGFEQVDQIYDPFGTVAMINTGLNAGRGVINYCGHGSPTSWGTTGYSNDDVNALVNDDMLPWIISVACNNGEFDSYTCFAEAWLRATNDSDGDPTGAIGCYASSISQYWDEPMCAQDESVDRFVAETYSCYGTLAFAGSCQMMDEYGGSGVDMFDTWIFFGDPSLRVVGTVAPATGMQVSPSSGFSSEGPNGGPFTPPSKTFTLTNHDPAPLAYAVTQMAPWLDVSNASGTLPVAGSVEVAIAINATAEFLGDGHYEDVVSFTNLTNHDGDTTRLVTLDVGVPEPVHVFSLDSDPSWSVTGQWEFGMPTGQGGSSHGNPDPTGGATGVNVLGVNLDGDYSTNEGGPYFVTTAPIDCSELSQVSLHFQRWLNTDYQPYVYATVEMSLDGSSWTLLWQNDNYDITDSSWSEQVFDLTGVADGQASLFVRWGYEVGSGAWAYSGWNIDDIEIWGIQPEPCAAFQRGDVNNDQTFGLVDVIVLLDHLFGGQGTPLPCDDAADGNDDGSLDISDPVTMLDVLFTGGEPLPPPAGTCGEDPTLDTLGCVDPSGCCP